MEVVMAPKLGKLPDETQLFLYSVRVVCGRQPEEAGCCVAGTRPGVYGTAISIHNFNTKAARLRKQVLPLVNAGSVVGREPAVADGRPTDQIELPPGSATMDDCCRIA